MIVFQSTTPHIFSQYRFASRLRRTKLHDCHGCLTKLKTKSFFPKLKTNNRKQSLVSIFYETFGVKHCALYYNHADVYWFTYILVSLSDRYWHMTYMFWYNTDTQFKLTCAFSAKGDQPLDVRSFPLHFDVGCRDIKVHTDVLKHLNCKFWQLWFCNKFANVVTVWNIYEIIHICTAVVDESEVWSSQ